MSYTKTIAKFVADLKYEDLPREVVEQAKFIVLHVLGVALAACQTKQGKDAIKLAKALSGVRSESIIWGDGTRVPCIFAAFANSVLSDVLDWEDCSWTGHPSATVVPATLALGETRGTSGKEVITAMVAGFEVYQRIAMACHPSDDWDWMKKSTGISNFNVWAAGIPAAKLLKLDEAKIEQAMGIIGESTPIFNSKHHTTMSDFYHYRFGFTCIDGMMSAYTAQSGVSGMNDILDGDNAYWLTVSDRCRWEWLTKGLGSDYFIMEILCKRWPANMWTQQFLDMTNAIINEESVKAGDISEIIVSPIFQKRMAYEPAGYDGAVAAEFSIPYCIASLLLDNTPGPNWYTHERFKDKKLLETASKVKAEGPEMKLSDAFTMFQGGKYPLSSVKIILKNGSKYEKTLLFPKGHPKNKFTAEEYVESFKQAAQFTLKSKQIEKIIDKTLSMENVEDISSLAVLLCTA